MMCDCNLVLYSLNLNDGKPIMMVLGANSRHCGIVVCSICTIVIGWSYQWQKYDTFVDLQACVVW